jgi:hypothetical protein
MRPLPPPEPFPLDALGPELAAVTQAICDIVQSPIEMCAGAVLASVSFAVSPYINIRLPTGDIKPVTNWVWCVAVSGGRKTATDGRAFAPQKQRQANLHASRQVDLEAYQLAHEMWEAQKKSLEKKYKTEGAGSEAHKQERELLGPEPEEPLGALLMSADFTYEGLTRCLHIGQPIYGIIGSEGGQFIGGHGMAKDAKLRTIANLSAVWDGEPIGRVRVNEILNLPGRRVGTHLMLQPEVAAQALSDELLIRQGFLSRILLSYPESRIGKRTPQEPLPEAAQILQRYQARLLSVLETPYPLAPGTRNELQPRETTCSEEAKELFWRFTHESEKQMAPGGDYDLIVPFAAKLPEHAARLGGAIAGYRDLNFPELSGEDYLRGMRIAVWYASENKRISGACSTGVKLSPVQALGSAQKLLDWIKDWPKPVISARDIYTNGPSFIRNRETAINLAEILLAHGHLEPVNLNTRRKDMKKWRITGRS